MAKRLDKRQMKDRIIKSKFYQNCLRFNIFYLVLPIIIYLIMWLCYNLAIFINHNEVILEHEIDKHIPYIKYFVVLYFTYYFMPIVLFWAISFKNKNKYYFCLLVLCINNLLCYIFYCFYSVKVIRESSVNINMSLCDINSFDSIFDYLVSFIYRIDKDALNSLPSIHAGTGLLMIIMSIPDKRCKLNIWLIVFGIFSGIGCILSTVFIKQHNLVDVIVGLILMLVVYTIAFIINKYKIKS